MKHYLIDIELNKSDMKLTKRDIEQNLNDIFSSGIVICHCGKGVVSKLRMVTAEMGKIQLIPELKKYFQI